MLIFDLIIFHGTKLDIYIFLKRKAILYVKLIYLYDAFVRCVLASQLIYFNQVNGHITLATVSETICQFVRGSGAQSTRTANRYKLNLTFPVLFARFFSFSLR